MMMNNEFLSLITLCAEKSAMKKLVFSRPVSSEITKIVARLSKRRGEKILALEYSLPGNTVSQKNIYISEIEAEILPLLSEYKQINLLSGLGDCERRLSKSGKELLLGTKKLENALKSNTGGFDEAVEELNRDKNHIFSGKEQFLIKLGISDATGRVHDKRQGKFRQINRFCEHIDLIYDKLPKDGEITVYDLCSGKSYLSFAVYHFLTKIKRRKVYMLGVDLKRDVINACQALAEELSYDGMHFLTDDVKNTPRSRVPDLLISLHACDIATDIVINEAIELGAKVILCTPCCHRYLNDKINADELKFVSDYPHLRNKLCEAITDGLRIARLRAHGYSVSALELTDPENTPKNTLIRAILNPQIKSRELDERRTEYEKILKFTLGERADEYLKEI